MSTELIVEDVWQAIQVAAHKARGRKMAAVAFIGADGGELLRDFGEGDVLVCNMSSDALRAGSTDPGAIATLLARGVVIYSHEHLHAKVYVLGNTTIVGSANVSASAASRLVEAATRTVDRALVAGARRFIESLCRDATEVDETYLAFARSVHRPPRGGSSAHQAAKAGPASNRLYVVCYYGADPPKLVEAHYAATRDKWEAAAGPTAKWYVDISWDDDEKWIQPGDWVLWVKRDGPSPEAFPPMKVLGRTHCHGQYGQIVTWFRAPYRERLTWDHVCSRVLTSTSHRLRCDQVVKSAAAVHALFALWKLSPDD